MARLISMNRIDDSGGGIQEPAQSPVGQNHMNGNCCVQIEWVVESDSAQSDSIQSDSVPSDSVQCDSAQTESVQSNHLAPTTGHTGLRKSPSMGNFSSKRTPVNVQWKNISLTTRKGKEILKKLSGAVCSGELTAIMGPSGAGKSSLLNVLSGFTRQKVTGEILVNGANREMRVFRKLTCYILQDDHILPRLTVREIVSMAASLKIPSKISKEEKHNAVDECLECLGLTEHANTKANKLSGGQRKRLCIAQELVSNPPLIFLDEPTSGLDSSSCLQCIQLLKSLAEDGRTVVCTIHQPSSKIFETFDKLYMLAKGQCIFRGRTQDLVPFLADQGLRCPQYHNPTDYVTEIAMGDYGNEWNEKLRKAIDQRDDISENSSQINLRGSEGQQESTFRKAIMSFFYNNCMKKSCNGQQEQDSDHAGYATSSFNQFRVLFYRTFLSTLREPMNTQLKLVGNIIVGLLFGTLYFGIGNDASKVYNNSGLIFCVLIFLIFTAKMPTILTFPLERTIFEREHMNSWYCTRMYYLATTAAEIPFQLLFPIITCSIVYWMTDQPNDISRFCLFLLSAILLSLVSQSIGQLIGAGSSVQNGVYIASVTSIPTLLFCGFFITMSTIPSYLQWLSYGSYARYAFQSIVLILYTMDRPPLSCNKTLCRPFEDPMNIVKEMDMEGDLYVDYSALLGFFLLFRLVTYLLLKFRVVRMQ